MSLYRDTGVVLRVHKLGEADRIVTLITRKHGKVRAVAKGVRRTKSRFGARLEPFGHVDVQFYTGRSLDIITQVETVDAVRHRHRRRLPALHGRLRGAGDGRPAGRRGGRAGDAALPAGGRRVTGARSRRTRPVPGARRVPAARHGLRGLGARRQPSARGAPNPARTRRSACRPAARSAPGAGRPAPAARPPRRWSCSRRCCTASGHVAESTGQSARREASGLVAALLQWHLERQLRSLPLVERRPPSPRPAVDIALPVGIELADLARHDPDGE